MRTAGVLENRTAYSVRYDEVMLKKKLVVHLGLPKTGTTTMQQQFFPKLDGYLGKRYLEDGSSYWSGGQSNHPLGFVEAHELYLRGLPWEDVLGRWVESLDLEGPSSLVVSLESLWFWPAPFGKYTSRTPLAQTSNSDKPRRGTHPVVAFLSELRRLLPADVDLMTVVTLRNQSDFLGSLGAQQQTVHHPNAVSRLLESDDASLDWHGLVTSLQDLVGKYNNLTLIFEDGVEQNCNRILDWLDPGGIRPEFTLTKPTNVRNLGYGSWRGAPRPFYVRFGVFRLLRNWANSVPGLAFIAIRVNMVLAAISPKIQTGFSISEPERDAIRSHCNESNSALSSVLGRDLSPFGY